MTDISLRSVQRRAVGKTPTAEEQRREDIEAIQRSLLPQSTNDRNIALSQIRGGARFNYV